MLEEIDDWNGRKIQCVRSRGDVRALLNYEDNLIRSGISVWPPPEIAQKLYQSRHGGAFADAAREVATRARGFYSDLQSLNSEDAVTWSVFGPLTYADRRSRTDFASGLLATLRVPNSRDEDAVVWLWRRLPHPDTIGVGGPEIDFGIQTPTVLVLGEAKWNSSPGRNQGKDKSKDQLTIRREFCRKLGRALFPSCGHFVQLTVSRNGGLLASASEEMAGAMYHERDMTWRGIATLLGDTARREVEAYLSWKERLSSPKPEADVAAELGSPLMDAVSR